MKNKKLFILALILGVCAFLGNTYYINNKISQYKDKKYVTVIRASKPIKGGTVLTSKLIEQARVPADFAPKSAIPWEKNQDYLQQEIAVDVLGGDYVLDSFFSTKGSIGRTLSEQLDAQDLRAITIPVDELNSFSRSIEAGDRVDVLFTFQPPMLKQKVSTLLLQNVPIISTGSYSAAEQELGERGGKGGRYNAVTFKLPAQDAIRLSYARQSGSISLLLRGTRDSNTISNPVISGVQDVLSVNEKESIENAIKNAKDSYKLSADGVSEQIKQHAEMLLEQQKKNANLTGIKQ